MQTETQEIPTEELIATPADVFGGDEPETTETTETKETPETKVVPQTSALTADDIKKSVTEGFKAAQPEPAARQYTQEEIDKYFNTWKPTTELVERIRAGGDDGLAAMVEMRDGLSKQFSTLLQYQVELVKQELMGHMAPALTFTQQQAATKDREEFFKQNEDLKDHEELTQTVFNALKAEGYVAKTVAEAYKTLADRTRKLLPTTATNGSGARQPAGARTTTTTQTKRPAALSSGSQAGGGGGDSAPATGYPGGEVFL